VAPVWNDSTGRTQMVVQKPLRSGVILTLSQGGRAAGHAVVSATRFSALQDLEKTLDGPSLVFALPDCGLAVLASGSSTRRFASAADHPAVVGPNPDPASDANRLEPVGRLRFRGFRRVRPSSRCRSWIIPRKCFCLGWLVLWPWADGGWLPGPLP